MQSLQELEKQLKVPVNKIQEIAQNFKNAIELGLRGERSPLLMLPSYIGKPSGKEFGTFLAVDMGGTNLRVAKFTINNRSINKIAEISAGLKSRDRSFDYTTSKTTAEELFDYIADKISQVVTVEENNFLGFTFSFPTKQMGINNATLIMWTKEINVTGVVGKNPNQLLMDALKRKKLNIIPCAIINDTVGTLLVAACQYAEADIGTILGTGHNTCYIEPNHPLTRKTMIVNMEAANFDWELPYTAYDDLLDAASNKPGCYRLEKMVSGAYLGELVRIIICKLAEEGLIFKNSHNRNPLLLEKYNLQSKLLSELIQNFDYIKEKFACSTEDAMTINLILTLVAQRAARLVAGTYIGTVLHIDPAVKQQHIVAIDGSIYEKLPGFKEELRKALDEALGIKSDKITLQLVKDGSGAGAIVAAAMATE